MSTLELNSIIAKGESETVEFKSNFNVETIETLVAFANSKGGCVYVGINDIGEIKGVSLSKESIQKWTNEIKNKTEPSLLPDIEIVNLYNKKIVVISVNEYPVKPISIKGRHYKRIGNSNHLMNVSEVSDCYMLSMQYSWDSYIRPDSSLKDIDSKRIKNFINRINKKGRVNLTGNNIEKLKKLKLIIDNKPTNAAMLLFAKDPLLYDVHAGRLKTPDLILDDKILRNTLFELVEETMRYIISHLKVAYEISSKTVLKTTQRTEIFEYPLEALRELVLNSIIHRKYNSSVDIQIKIFDNKISIFNPGELYGNITIEDLQHDDYQASARNKLIVEAFYLTGDIEKYGTGYRRIREALKNYPTMKFDFKEIQGGFLAELSYQKQRLTENAVDNVVDNVVENVVDNVVENEQKTLALLKENNTLSAKEIANKLKITERTIQRYIKKLQEKKLIKRIGPAKGGYWEIIK